MRNINSSEVLEALRKGSEKSDKIIISGGNLKDQFDRAIWAANHLLDNFDKGKFKKRENYKQDTEFLKLMLLGAFESVQCLGDLQEEINRTSNSSLLMGDADSLHITLLKAVSVYQSNGGSDAKSLCAHRLIKQYRDGVDTENNAPVVIPLQHDCA